MKEYQGAAVRVRSEGKVIPHRVYIVDAGGHPQAGKGWTMHESNAFPDYQLRLRIDETTAIDAETMKFVKV